ncbi:MAG TPA: hypothetical protein VKB51_14415 [bacterium]|nr:hypothetical protein [bacterium]
MGRPGTWTKRGRQAVLLAMLVGAVYLALPGPARADFDYDSYAPDTIAGVLKRNTDVLKEALADSRHLAIDTALSKVRLLVEYNGKRRHIAADAAALIDAVGRALPAIPDGYLALFRQEIAVQADGEPYWLPVQAQLVPYIDTELHRGDPVYLYAVFIGVNGQRPVFLVNEFDKARVD